MLFRAITATLKLRTPLHVGTGKGTEVADDLIYRDAQGRPCLRGTAVAGSLRSLATRLAARFKGERECLALADKKPDGACGCLVCQLFGEVNPREKAGEGSASRVMIYDATLSDATGIQVRDGVGIDRATGTAARRERIKFDLEVLPAGTQFKLRLELDPVLRDERALQLLAATLAEWRAGRGTVGGAASRGLGALQILDDVQLIERDLNHAPTLMAFLRDGPPWEADDGDHTWVDTQVAVARGEVSAWTGESHLPVARSWARAEFTLAASGPFLTHDLVQAGRSGFDHAPALAAYEKGARPVLPGSSLRGVLRGHAERIARTMATLAAWDYSAGAAERQERFAQICPACNPLAARTEDPVASCNSFIKTLTQEERSKLARAGAEDKLCLACRLFGSAWNGSRLRVEDAFLEEGSDAEYKVLDFLAIDRFTGGGKEGAKFDAAVLWRPRFRVRLFLDNPQAWELGWLALVLRDVHEGLATIGFGRAKGFGRCTIEDPQLTLGILDDTDLPLPEPEEQDVLKKATTAAQRLSSARGEPSGLYQTVIYDPAANAEWLALANGWIWAFRDAAARYTRPGDFPPIADSYFTEKSGRWLPDLYPARVS